DISALNVILAWWRPVSDTDSGQRRLTPFPNVAVRAHRARPLSLREGSGAPSNASLGERLRCARLEQPLRSGWTGGCRRRRGTEPRSGTRPSQMTYALTTGYTGPSPLPLHAAVAKCDSVSVNTARSPERDRTPAPRAEPARRTGGGVPAPR